MPIFLTAYAMPDDWSARGTIYLTIKNYFGALKENCLKPRLSVNYESMLAFVTNKLFKSENIILYYLSWDGNFFTTFRAFHFILPKEYLIKIPAENPKSKAQVITD